MGKNLKILNINASRINRKDRLINLLYTIKALGPNVICIQEINIREAYNTFKDSYECIINGNTNMGDGIGIITMVEKGIIVKEKIIGECGRIIGVKVENIQVWNVYPISGAGNKQKRELFFRGNW